MDKKPESLYEIELKAIFDKAKYDELDKLLNGDEKFKPLNKESITTEFFKADQDKTDVRLRNSDKTIEIVCKKGLVTRSCRKEIRIPLESMDHLNHFCMIFDLLPLTKNPQTLKHKQEFLYNFNGYDYVVCLQHIENFAYLMEVEFMAEQDDSEIHEPNLLGILVEFGLKLIDDAKFLKRVEDYKKGINTIDYEV
jgi:adenylate cyclase class IV